MFLECGNCGQRLTASHAPADARGVQCPHCGATVPIFDQNTLVPRGAPPPEPVAPVPPLQIEGYEILGCLGEGGMGIVYLARQVSLDRKVAIKVMSPALLKDPSFVARFDREIAALVRLSHPHIVTIFDRGQSPAGHVYYVMEYVEGRDGGPPIDLERLIADRCLNSQQVRALMLQVVQALGFAHSKGIIHRDVKPSNILIDQHGFAKVADFGIASMRASRATPHVTVANQSVGTAIYMSPEQQRDAASVDHRTDIYAAGVMLYQMLTGELPLAGYEPPSKVVAGLSPEWDAIVATALQQRPENRFPDMRAFEAALQSIGQTSAGQPIPIPSPRTATPPGVARGTSAGRVPPTTGQQSAVTSKAEVIKRAEQLFVQGQWKKAADLMAKAAAFFVGDEEIHTLMVQYREKAHHVDQVLARMAALAQQNRWCEVSQIIAELQQSGVSVKGLEQYAAAAQQKLGALQPLVATARSLLQQDRTAEALAHASRALQYVADHAEALEIADTARKRSTRRRRWRRLVVGLFTVACLAAIAGGAYLYFTEAVVIDKARRQLANREYEDALRTLADLPHRWFVHREATYLQAVLDFRKYASGKAIDDAVLETSTQRLKDVLAARKGWLAQAKRELADAVALVRSDAKDALPRALKIARKLNDLKLADPSDLAQELLTKAQGRTEFQQPASDATPVDYVRQVLEWDATKATAVVGLALPKDGSRQQEELPERLQAIQSWVKRTPSLGTILRPAVLQVADPYVRGGSFEEARLFVETATAIDPHFDACGYWEQRVKEAAAKNPQAAVEILRVMVKGEQNRERVRRATELYVELRVRYTDIEIPPPPEIGAEIDRTRDAELEERFRKLIAEAEQLVKNGQYRDARAKLDEARNLSPELSDSDPKAKELNEKVEFRLNLEDARKSYESGDFAGARLKVARALKIRPEDKEALELRDKVQIELDKAEFEQHLKQAKSALAEGNAPGAVDEILKARDILGKPSNAEWSASSAAPLDELAKTLIGELREQAKELSDKRQYEDAKEKVGLGLRLLSNDESLLQVRKELLQVRKEIEDREADPKTANISGIWESSEGGKYEFRDDGGAVIACRVIQLPPTMKTFQGEWKRDGNRLTGRLWVEFVDNPGRVTGVMKGDVEAVIENSNTLKVFWARTKLTSLNPPRFQGIGEARWTKRRTGIGESPTPGDGEKPGARAPGVWPTPQIPEGTHQDPFGSRPNSSRGRRSPAATNLAAEPLPNGVVVNGLSIAIVRPITRHGDAAEVSLGFRRVDSPWGGHGAMRLTIHDDRSNEYSTHLGFPSLEGTPPAVRQLPAGFTWIRRIEVQMPVRAIEHIVQVELSDWLPGGQKHWLQFRNPSFPLLEFKVPADRLLSPGAKVRLDKNLVAEIGELAADSSSGLSLSLPISVTNEDYNPHPCPSFKLYVQSVDGEVWEYCTIGERRGWSSEELPGKTTRKLSPAPADSGSGRSLSEGLHAVLLYRSPDFPLDEPRFCGFVRIPDEVRQRMKKITNE